MNEQEEYKRFVLDYFNDFGISLSDDMGFFYTSCVKETDRIYFPFEKKVNGKYIDLDSFKPKYYFVGDYDTSFCIYTWMFIREIENGFDIRFLNDYKCAAQYRRKFFDFATIITNFVKAENG